MGASQSELTGPDLAQGVPAADLPDGIPVLGHAAGEAVVVVRRGDEIHALGATCTHYGAPLAEGLVVGDTLRCPWHHAAFDLRTADRERPPALDDLPCWNVEENDGQIRVTSRAVRPETPSRRARPGGPESVVIVGAGAAGIVAADTLRREGYEGRITIADGDRDAPVDRPNLSKEYLAGSAPEEWVSLRPPHFFRERGIDAIIGSRVSALDLSNRRLTLDDGSELGFGALLLATGASPVQLPLTASELLPWRTLRSLADSRATIADAGLAGPGGRAVVIGASFIGLEVAASL